jgi:hypothetical protein
MRRRGRVDGNQAQIVDDLRKFGASVQSLSSIGGGCPDLLVGYRGLNFLFEVKDPKQKPSDRILTEDELKWHSGWRGNCRTIESSEQAIDLLKNS